MKIPKTLLKKFAQLNDSKHQKEDSLEMTDLECSDAALSQQVLLSEDLLSKIFEQLSLVRPAGFTEEEIARCEREQPPCLYVSRPRLSFLTRQTHYLPFEALCPADRNPRLLCNDPPCDPPCDFQFLQVWACVPGLETGLSPAALGGGTQAALASTTSGGTAYN